MTRHFVFNRMSPALIGWLCLANAVLLSLSAPAIGLQPANQKKEQEEADDRQPVFLRPPRELSRPITRAKRAISEGNYRDAVELLGDALSQSQAEDYLIPVAGSSGVVVSLRGEAQRLLGSIPKKYRESYELRFGIEARQWLQEATEKADYDLLAQITRKYFHTESGYLAAMLLGHHHLEEGRPFAAAYCFQRVVATVDARRIHDPEASVLLATCWMLGGSVERAEATLVELKGRNRGRGIKFQGRAVEWFDKNEQAGEWLAKLVGDSPLLNNRLVNQWLMFRGNAARNAQSGSGFPLKYPRWRVPTINDPDTEKIAIELRDEILMGNSTSVPCLHPLAVGDTILMKSAEKLIGVDFKTGKRNWVYPEDYFFSDDEEVEEQLYGQYSRQYLLQRLWMDAVLGQTSSDGKLIFAVNEAGYVGGTADLVVSPNGRVAPSRLGVTETNILQGVEIRRQGAVKWQVGGETGWDEPKLAGSFFLGPPLPLHDELYVLYEQDTEIRMGVLNAESGKLRWSQQIANIESLEKIGSQPTRRLAGASPSFSDGILICPTSSTAIVAIDISTRSLLWGFQYQGAEVAATRFFDAKFDDTWRDSSITVSGGAVVMTPVDDNRLFCLDLLTGIPRWKRDGKTVAIDRGDSIFVGCVENGQIVLVGRNAVRGIDINSGDLSWTVELGIEGRPSGHGYVNRGHYFLPTTASRLVKIDLNQGKIVKSVRTDRVLGNLICYRGDVISHGVDWVSCYPQDEPLRRQLKVAEREGPLDETMLLQKAQLVAQRGELFSAIKMAREVDEKKSNPIARALIYDFIIDLMKQDFHQGLAWSREYEKELLEYRPFDFIDAKLSGMLNPKFQDASPKLIREVSEAASELVKSRGVSNRTFQPVGDGQTMMRFDYACRARLRKLLDSSRPSLRRIWRMETEGYAYRSNRPEDRKKLLRLVESHGADLFSVAVQVAVADWLIDSGQWLKAEMVLAPLMKSDEPLVVARAEAGYARLLEAAKMKDEVAQQYQRLNTEFGDVKCGESTGKEIYEQYLQRVSKKPVEKTTAWPTTGPVVTKQTQEGHESNSPTSRMVCQQNLSKCGHLIRLSITTDEWKLKIVDQHGTELGKFGFLNVSGRRRFYVAQNAEGNYWIYGHLLVAGFGNELIGIDLFKLFRGEDALLWQQSLIPSVQLGNIRRNAYRQPFRPQMTTNSWGERRVRLVNDNQLVGAVGSVGPYGVAAFRSDQVICLDPLTGERIWQRGGYKPGSDLTGDSETVCVVNPQSLEIHSLSIVDGSPIESTTIESRLGKEWWKLDTLIFLTNSDKKTKRLTCWDIAQDSERWSKTFPVDTLACLVDSDRAAFYQQDGTLQLLDLRRGELLFETKIPKLKKVYSIAAYESKNEFLFALNQNQNFQSYHRIAGSNVSFQSLNYSRALLNGYLFAVDAQGKARWSRPVRVEFFDTPLYQLWDVPAFVMNRMSTIEGQRMIETIAIDCRNGRTLLDLQSEKTHSRFTRLRGRPDSGTVEIASGTTQFEVAFSNEPRTPGPPASFTTQRLLADRPGAVKLAKDSEESESRDDIIKRLKARQAEFLKRQEEIRRLNHRQRQKLDSDAKRPEDAVGANR